MSCVSLGLLMTATRPFMLYYHRVVVHFAADLLRATIVPVWSLIR